MASSSIPVTRGAGGKATADVNGFRVTDLRFAPLVTCSLHRHERACLAVVIDGRVDKSFRRLEVPSPAPTVVTMPPEEPHADRFGCDGARIVVVEADAATVERLRPFGRALERVDHFRDDWSAGVATRLARELRREDRAAPLAIEGLVLELLARAARSDAPRARRPPAWLGCATEYVHAHFGDAFRVGDVAAAAGVHPVHLARVFRAHHGVTIGAYVRRLRLDWASWELARSDASLATIAHRAGFADQSHFTRAFKSHVGVTPGRYREASRD